MAKTGNPVIGIGELTDLVAAETGWDKASAKEAISSVQNAVIKACRDGKDVRLVGFATFSNVFKPAHEATNPQNPTGPKIAVPDKNVFTAKASKGVDMTPPAPAKPAAPARRRR